MVLLDPEVLDDPLAEEREDFADANSADLLAANALRLDEMEGAAEDMEAFFSAIMELKLLAAVGLEAAKEERASLAIVARIMGSRLPLRPTPPIPAGPLPSLLARSAAMSTGENMR